MAKRDKCSSIPPNQSCFHVNLLYSLELAGLHSYLSAVVNSVGSVPEIYDSDGAIISFESGNVVLFDGSRKHFDSSIFYSFYCIPVLFAIFEFISALVDDPSQIQLFPPILPDLAHYLIALMQVSSEQVLLFHPSQCCCSGVPHPHFVVPVPQITPLNFFPLMPPSLTPNLPLV